MDENLHAIETLSWVYIPKGGAALDIQIRDGILLVSSELVRQMIRGILRYGLLSK